MSILNNIVHVDGVVPGGCGEVVGVRGERAALDYATVVVENSQQYTY